MQKAKSGLSARLGSKLSSAFKAHKDDETTFGVGADCPPGVNGIARLTACKFDQYKSGENVGKDYFYAAGVVVSPTHHEGIPIEGLRTSIMEPLCDTKSASGKGRQSIEEHLDWILTALRSLGVDTSSLTEDGLEAAAAALQEAGPYFRFSTSQGEKTAQYPNPRVWHNWGKVVDFEGGESEDVVDNTEEGETVEEGGGEVDLDALAESADGDDAEAQEQLKALAAEQNIDSDEFGTWAEVVAKMREDEGEGETTEGEAEESVDYAALGKKADKGDDDAISALDTAGREAGLDPDTYDSWGELATALAEGGGEGETTEEAAATWNMGDIAMFKPLDPKTKKPGKKAVECEIVAINHKAETVSLLNQDDKKTKYSNIPFSRLETA